MQASAILQNQAKALTRVLNWTQVRDLSKGPVVSYDNFITYKEVIRAQICLEKFWKTGNNPWEILGMMGPHHISTIQGQMVFSAPYASIGYSSKDDEKSRIVGTIVQDVGHQKIVANGNWKEAFVPNEGDSFLLDPHVMDETGYAIAQGNFFPTNEAGQHFAVGAPNANRLTGRVYICYKCFRPDNERKVKTTDGSRIDPSVEIELRDGMNQTGSRFGAALAAVDINGDGFDDLVVGAPLHSDTVILESNLLFHILIDFYSLFFSEKQCWSCLHLRN